MSDDNIKTIGNLISDSEQRITKSLRQEIADSEQRVTKALDKKISTSAKILRAEIAESRKNLHQEIANSEKRVTKTLDKRISESEKKLEGLILVSEERVVTEVGKFVEDHLLPLIDEKADKSKVESLERRMDNISAKVMEHDQALKELKTQV